MASITVPTPIQTTARTISGYIYNASTSDLQTLLGDTDFTCDGKYMYYKGIPVFCNGRNNSNYLMMATKNGQSSQGGLSFFGDGGDTIYIYDFNTFYCFRALAPITHTGTNDQLTVIIDKVNVEILEGFRVRGDVGCTGILFNYMSNTDAVHDCYFPSEHYYGTTGNDNIATGCREESASDVSYIKLTGATGKQATRMYFFTKFPRGSSNGTLHVDDKYFYLFPIDETLYTVTEYDASHTSSSHTQEVYCTLGIDVTAEINAQS